MHSECEECKFEADKQVWCVLHERGALPAIMIKTECQQLYDEAPCTNTAHKKSIW